MAGYHGPGPDPSLVIRPKPPSSAPVILLLVLMAGAGVSAFFLMTRGQDDPRSSGCIDTVYDLPASSASTSSTFQCTPQQAVQVNVAPDGHRVIACRCRGRYE